MTRRFIKLRTQAHLMIQAASVRRTKPAPRGSRCDSDAHLKNDDPAIRCRRAAGCDC